MEHDQPRKLLCSDLVPIAPGDGQLRQILGGLDGPRDHPTRFPRLIEDLQTLRRLGLEGPCLEGAQAHGGRAAFGHETPREEA